MVLTHTESALLTKENEIQIFQTAFLSSDLKMIWKK